jgi:integrase/recombinase XerD
VLGFKELYSRLLNSVKSHNLSLKTYRGYCTQLSKVCLEFNTLPEGINQIGIEKYLPDMAESSEGPSLTSLQLTAYALRYYFKKILLNEPPYYFPNIKQGKSLPIVLSQSDCKMLLASALNLKHTLLLCTTYSAGLRLSEVINLKLKDLDFDRMTLTVRKGKGQKDRCLPLAKALKKGLLKYQQEYKPFL